MGDDHSGQKSDSVHVVPSVNIQSRETCLPSANIGATSGGAEYEKAMSLPPFPQNKKNEPPSHSNVRQSAESPVPVFEIVPCASTVTLLMPVEANSIKSLSPAACHSISSLNPSSNEQLIYLMTVKNFDVVDANHQARTFGWNAQLLTDETGKSNWCSCSVCKAAEE